MAHKMTKQEMVNEIEKTFKEHPDMEVVVAEYNFRNARWGLHGYCLCLSFDNLMLRPWSGANTYWKADLMKLKKQQLADLMEKTWKSI